MLIFDSSVEAWWFLFHRLDCHFFSLLNFCTKRVNLLFQINLGEILLQHVISSWSWFLWCCWYRCAKHWRKAITKCDMFLECFWLRFNKAHKPNIIWSGFSVISFLFKQLFNVCRQILLLVSHHIWQKLGLLTLIWILYSASEFHFAEFNYKFLLIFRTRFKLLCKIFLEIDFTPAQNLFWNLNGQNFLTLESFDLGHSQLWNIGLPQLLLIRYYPIFLLWKPCQIWLKLSKYFVKPLFFGTQCI